jgi:hypothetical protein
MHITFDTLEMVRRLEAKGFKREQAEEIVSVVKDVQQELATKSDTNEVKVEIEILRKEVKNDIEVLRKEVKNDIEVLRKDVDFLRKEVKTDIEVLRRDIEVFKRDIIIKISSITFVLLLAFKVLDKFI